MILVKCYFVLPSLKVSGGVSEAMRLGSDLTRAGVRSALLCMWRTDRALPSELAVHELSESNPSARGAILKMASSFVRFRRWKRAQEKTAGKSCFVFTHYATLPLAWAVPEARRFFFVQDIEWRFLQSGFASRALRRIILYFYRRGRLVSANAYLTATLRELGLSVEFDAPIWASAEFRASSEEPRDIDFVMVLRKGAHKRLDLYLSFIELARRQGDLKVAVISPEDEIIGQVRDVTSVALLRPTIAQMRALYSRSKCFVHLSDHEGFGLPPLEAMGSGCVPLCRDSGGVRAFMWQAPLSSMLIPLGSPIQAFFEKANDVLRSSELQSLSVHCRQVFARGLDTAEHRVVDLVRAMR